MEYDNKKEWSKAVVEIIVSDNDVITASEIGLPEVLTH